MKAGKYLCVCTECDDMVCYYTPRFIDVYTIPLLPNTCPNNHYVDGNPVAKWKWNDGDI